jgi:hypothetical protein
MLTTSAFAAPFGFVVWTVSCRYDLPVQSLHVPASLVVTPATQASLGIATANQLPEVSPNLSSSTGRQSKLTHRQPIAALP